MSKAAKFLAGVGFMVSTFNAVLQERDTLKTQNEALETENASLKAEVEASKPEDEGLSEEDLDKALTQIETVTGPLNDDGTAASLGKTQASTDPVAVTVAAPVTAPAQSVPVSGSVDQASVGASVSGPGIADGTTVHDVTQATLPDNSTVPAIVLSQPTTADHAGDGTETLTVTPAVA